MDTALTITPENVNQINQKLAIIAKQIRRAFDCHDYELGKNLLLEKVLKIAPNHPTALTDLAFAENKLGNTEQAYEYLTQALKYNQDKFSAIYDSFVGVCSDLNRREEAYYYAKLAIKTKKQEVAQLSPTLYPLPKQLKTGLHPDKKKNIIAYSLFGKSPRYCETAVINSRLAQFIYPEWTCRFYVDSSVPQDVIQRLQQQNAEIVYIDKLKIPFSGLFWRFLVLDDPNVHCFMIRDADSLISYKEQRAVKQWLDSGKYFHLMRDAYCHSELILAGMWGGYTGIFKDIQQCIEQYYAKLTVLNKTIDQHFLRECIWTTVNQDVLIHDNYHLEENSIPFPDYPLSDIERIPYFHIGMVDAGLNTVTTYVETYATNVRWYLYNVQYQNIICSYESPVMIKDGKTCIELNLPYFYSQNIKNKLWDIKFQSLY